MSRLEFHMPVMDGFELYETIRKIVHFSKTPIFFITSNPNDEVKIKSFKNGAADFFDRLIQKDEMIARLQARIESFKESMPLIKMGNMVLDFHRVECFIKDQKITLTLLEFRILGLILKTYPNLIPGNDLVQSIWRGEVLSANNVNTHISNLRSKLIDWNFEISNQRGEGFLLKQK